MKKRLVAMVLTMAMVFTLAGCGKTADLNKLSAPDSIRITTKDGNDELIEVEVPYDPQRIAVLDLAALDILDYLGVGERIVGMAKGTTVDYLRSYSESESIRNLGTIKEADLEAVMACDPDVIFIGGRLSAFYQVLSEIAPVISISTDYEMGLIESVKTNAAMMASLFGKEQKFQDTFISFENRVNALAATASEHTAIVGMVTSSNLTTLGNASRCSLIGNEIGFFNLASDVDSTHGNESSFELVAKLDPEYIFVLDRDAAISTQGAQLAKEVMDNELVHKTTAFKNDNIYYLSPAVWYLAEGGLTATDIMLSDLEAAILP